MVCLKDRNKLHEHQFLNKNHFPNPKKWGINISYFGDFKSKRELISYIHKAQREFQRYTKRLCFKWGERNVSLWNVLPLFTKEGWMEIHRVNHERVFHKSFSKGEQSKNQTWWVVFTIS